MNPYFRTGSGVTDENTVRLVLASDSPGAPLNYDAVELEYIGSTNNLNAVTYRLDSIGVRALAFEYLGDTNQNNAKISKITVIPPEQILNNPDPGFTNPGFGFGPGGGITPA
jgi:hypothetical protein